MVALAHGTNDAQKTMGIITLTLITAGVLAPGLGAAVLGDPLLGARDRAGHLHGRLADHPDPRQARQRDPDAAGLRRRDQHRDRHPDLVAPRLRRCPPRRSPPARSSAPARVARLASVHWGVAGQMALRVAADPARGRGRRRRRASGWPTPARSARSSSSSSWSPSRRGHLRRVAASPGHRRQRQRRPGPGAGDGRRLRGTHREHRLGIPVHRLRRRPFAVGVAIVALVAFALVGLSARVGVPAGGPDDGAKTLSPAVGTAVAGVCLLAVALIVGYGLWIIIA